MSDGQGLATAAGFTIISALNFWAYRRGVRRVPMVLTYRWTAAPFLLLAFTVLLLATAVHQVPSVAACEGLIRCDDSVARVDLGLFIIGMITLGAGLKEALRPSRWRRLPEWWCAHWEPNRPKNRRF